MHTSSSAFVLLNIWMYVQRNTYVYMCTHETPGIYLYFLNLFGINIDMIFCGNAEIYVWLKVVSVAWSGRCHQLLIHHRHLPWLETDSCITFSAQLPYLLLLCLHHVWHLFNPSLLDNFFQRWNVKKIHHASCTVPFHVIALISGTIYTLNNE